MGARACTTRKLMKTNHTAPAADAGAGLGWRNLGQYFPGVRSIYSNATDSRTEAVLLEFGVFKLDHTLTNGRTLLEHMRLRPKEGLNATLRMRAAWRGVRAALSVVAMGECGQRARPL